MLLPCGFAFSINFLVSSPTDKANNLSLVFSEKENDTLKNPSYIDNQNIGFTLFVPRDVVHLYSPLESQALLSL